MVIITVRGKENSVVLSIDEYNRLRELELDAAVQESRKDVEEEVQDRFDRRPLSRIETHELIFT